MKNKQTILDLYERYIDDIYKETFKSNQLTNEITALENKLDETLSEEQKLLLTKIRTKEKEQEEKICREVFSRAFSLSTKLFIESIQKD